MYHKLHSSSLQKYNVRLQHVFLVTILMNLYKPTKHGIIMAFLIKYCNLIIQECKAKTHRPRVTFRNGIGNVASVEKFFLPHVLY